MESHFNRSKHSYQDRATSTHESYTVDDDSNIHQNRNVTGVPSQDFGNSSRPSTSKFPGSARTSYLNEKIFNLADCLHA